MLLKRCIDIVVSAFALLLLSPTLIAVAVLLWLDSGRPVLFRQRRVGLGFRQFDILKFRTMRVQAGGPAITVAGDARITRVGRFLRAAKLDEMPQFWNVLIGDMSLVGPRPEVPEYVEMFHDRYRHILTVRPGITDIASVRFRNEENLLAKGPEPLSEYVQRILPLKLDLADEYIRARSLQLDCLILLKTLLVTLVPHRGDLFLSIHLRIRKLTVAVESNEWLRRCLIWITHLGLFAISGVAAFSLRFDLHIPPSEIHHLWFALAVWLTIKPIVFRWLELDRGWWRFVSMDDLIRIAFGNFVGSVAGFIAIRFLGPSGFPRAIYFLDLFLCFLATSGIRASVRILREGREAARGQNEKRTLIYGAGNAGVILLREIRNNPKLPYRVVSFIDDRPDKQGLRISGVLVRGSGDDVKTLVERLGIQTILIAIPSATGLEMTRILRLCHAAGTECKTIPSLDEVIGGNGLANQIREVSVEDLLGRTPVQLEEDQIRRGLEGKVVLVTGAAGSIGSELCRQITRFHPAGIVGFDVAESPLFEIDREMRGKFSQIPFHAEIGSIQNRSRLNEVFSQYRPSVVYHAAAYKHVPMMETHVFEAITNNVFGTYYVATAAMRYGVDDFVMVSSDKAVRPTNVMGATKRIAELLLLGLQNGCTKFVAVRFGNVLGSNGSVIPIFKKQIAVGGPVTVTHPEMRRFFMTIPEACQLVLQAAAIAKGGQICVLDMGEPVKIVDLARNLILLSGLRPGEDIKIEFTGMRPGEKLYEELSTLLEDTVPTSHEKIRIFMGNGMPESDIQSWLESLHEICMARDTARLVVALKEIVLDYNPSTDLLKRLISLARISGTSVPDDGPVSGGRREESIVTHAAVDYSAPHAV